MMLLLCFRIWLINTLASFGNKRVLARIFHFCELADLLVMSLVPALVAPGLEPTIIPLWKHPSDIRNAIIFNQVLTTAVHHVYE